MAPFSLGPQGTNMTEPSSAGEAIFLKCMASCVFLIGSNNTSFTCKTSKKQKKRRLLLFSHGTKAEKHRHKKIKNSLHKLKYLIQSNPRIILPSLRNLYLLVSLGYLPDESLTLKEQRKVI